MITESFYAIGPNGNGDMSLWRVDNGLYDWPIELLSKHTLDAADPLFWPALVECFVGGIADNERKAI